MCITLIAIGLTDLICIKFGSERTRPVHNFLSDFERQLRRRCPTALPRQLPGQQFAEHQAQGVDIGRRTDCLAENLFGRGIGGRQHAHAGTGHGLFAALLDQLGDAEIKHAR